MDSLLDSKGGFYSINKKFKNLVNFSHIPKFEIFRCDKTTPLTRISPSRFGRIGKEIWETLRGILGF
jgi:hypothetical protein